MRPQIIVGSALTAAVLTTLAAVIGGVIAVGQTSVDNGVVVRSFLVVIALGTTAVVFWLRMTPRDRPEALLLGLLGGWVLNPSSWAGASYAGQIFTSHAVAAFLIDLILWGATALGLITVLHRTSSSPTRR